MIKRCDCKHAFQDSKYGSQMRVHTIGQKVFRCTVCGKETPKSDK